MYTNTDCDIFLKMLVVCLGMHYSSDFRLMDVRYPLAPLTALTWRGWSHSVLYPDHYYRLVTIQEVTEGRGHPDTARTERNGRKRPSDPLCYRPVTVQKSQSKKVELRILLELIEQKRFSDPLDRVYGQSTDFD